MANRIKSIFTNDGNALFFNIVLTEKEDASTLLFPYHEWEIGECYYGKMYCIMSSTLPLSYNQKTINQCDDNDVLSQRMGFLFNVKLKDLFDAILSVIPQ